MNDAEGLVHVGIVHGGEHHTVSFSHSLLALYGVDPRVGWSPPVQVRAGTNGLVEARNSIMAHFLDKTTAEWLLMIDDDMGFRADLLDRLLDAATRPEVQALVQPAGGGVLSIPPVVGALCFGLKREQAMTDLGGYETQPFPTLYEWGEVEWPDGTRELGFKVRPSYEPDSLIRVAGTGAAALLVHRRAAARVRDTQCEGRPEWFEHVRYLSGTKVSEDLSFCYRLNAAGIPIYVHTGVRTSHMKTVWVDEEYYLRDLAARMAAEAMREVSIDGESDSDGARLGAGDRGAAAG